MRLFVAVFPPPEIGERLHRAALRLPVEGDVRWVRPANVHLTLKFLGDAREEDLDAVVAATASACARHAAFEAEATGFGAFPTARRARVLWAGVGEGSAGLRALAEDVETALEPLGFGRERRPYEPHFTLGRARGRPVVLGTPVGDPGEGIGVVRLGFRVERVDVMRSVLGAGGAVYEVVGSRDLAAGSDASGGDRPDGT